MDKVRKPNISVSIVLAVWVSELFQNNKNGETNDGLSLHYRDKWRH
jgi:hypothetical protein